MKLYTDYKGRWAGTQSDAKQFGAFEQVEVPTDKPNLLVFLNDYQVASSDAVSAQVEVVQQKTHPQSCSANPNVYDVRDAVLNCDRKHLGSALAAIISRLHDEVEEA
jgi:hypothetical protein